MKGYFFTFGSSHKTAQGESLLGYYVKMDIENLTLARIRMQNLRGRKWAFVYPMSDLERQVKEYGLKERTLDEVAL